MDSSYLDYLEHSPASHVSASALVRLAVALETTPIALRGGDLDRPPRALHADWHQQVEVLSRRQCQQYLEDGGVGRLVFLSAQGPVALPVNFRLIDGAIVFRVGSTGSLAVATRSSVSFEVDRIDEAMNEGWSVLVTGRARRMDDPAERERMGGHEVPAGAWGEQEMTIRIDPDAVSGRAIRRVRPYAESPAGGYP
jgi:nitroimidazol reductase NimA-like FMN-containing flavoprotein (pyridoxamine 5'-phosphate oxidase superfamily)